MSCRLLLASALLVPIPAQEWVHYRGPGELLPPELGGPANNMADFTVWEFAWAFQRDLLLPAAASSPLAPAALAKAAAALAGQCRAGDDPLAVLSLWGLARIARTDDAAAKSLQQVVLGGLLQHPGPGGEVAALALGLGARGDAKTIAVLRDLANDTAAGRASLNAAAVPERTRCYALYGLGLAAENHPDAALQFLVLAGIERLLLPEADTPVGVRIAALHTLLMVQIQAAPTLPGPALHLLEQAWSREEPDGMFMVRSQVPLAAAAMLGADDQAADAWRERFVRALSDGSTSNPVRRSCAQSLGRIGRPADSAVVEALRVVGEGLATPAGKDHQTCVLALFALGTIGGKDNHAWLLPRLTGAGTFFARPWIALGLGAGLSLRREAASPEVVGALEAEAHTANPAWYSSAAAGLALCRSRASATLLTNLLERHAAYLPERHAGQGDVAAPLCVALGLAGDDRALPALRKVAGTAGSAMLCGDAMAAMALLGGDEARAELRAWLLDAKSPASRRYAAARALTGRADPATVETFAGVLADAKAATEERQFAAFALGSLCDAGPKHWSARLAASIDYRSATPVLVGLPFGVLRLP